MPLEPNPVELINVATFDAASGESDTLGVALLNLVEPSRSEPGCLSYDVHQSPEDLNRWMVLENWRSDAAFDEHMATPHVVEFLSKARQLCRRDFSVEGYRRRSPCAEGGASRVSSPPV